MANTYFFCGVVLPERALLSLTIPLTFRHFSSDATGEATVSIILNQVAVTIETEDEWDIFDLRNVVRYLVRNELAMVGYVTGNAYELEITRVLNSDRKIDYVFGIDTYGVSQQVAQEALTKELSWLRRRTGGDNGVYFHRCFSDLMAASKSSEDTGFYCYRSIESLRHHCAATNNLRLAAKSLQWEKFREQAKCNIDTIGVIKDAADPTRHGECLPMTGDKRTGLLKSTWKIVKAYLDSVPENAA